MNIAALVVGIDGWEQYTKPLVQSIMEHEPECAVIVVDNASNEPYPLLAGEYGDTHLRRTERLCYSAAINKGAEWAYKPDWTIVLSNDVLCTGPFAHMLAELGDSDVAGPWLKETHGYLYLEGWCVCIPRRIWDAVGGWDERFLGSDWEDVAFSTRARQLGFGLIGDTSMPFVHLDQKQRYHIVDDFWGKDAHNRELFMREYAAVTA